MANLSRFARLLLLGCLLCAMHTSAQAQAPAAGLERQVKAAYLFKFASFVEWPDASFARPDSALQIGVAGSEALGELHILFLDTSLERGAMNAMLTAARGQSLLTVSDSGEAMTLGCMINFLVADDKLRFDVALNHVTPSRLRISARMLAVAHKVQGAT